ncbi:hypothetical protein ABK040_000156 [Willaertia magna]
MPMFDDKRYGVTIADHSDSSGKQVVFIPKGTFIQVIRENKDETVNVKELVKSRGERRFKEFNIPMTHVKFLNINELPQELYETEEAKKKRLTVTNIFSKLRQKKAVIEEAIQQQLSSTTPRLSVSGSEERDELLDDISLPNNVESFSPLSESTFQQSHTYSTTNTPSTSTATTPESNGFLNDVSPNFDLVTTPRKQGVALDKERLASLIATFYRRKKFIDFAKKSPELRDARLRKEALFELYTTETSYYNSLKTCEKLFIEPLKKEAQTKKKPILKLQEIEDMFGELGNITTASGMLLGDLKKAIDKWPNEPVLIGKPLNSFAHFFKMYSKYINSFDSIAEKVEALEKSSKPFAQFLHKVYENPENGGFILTAYLITPVQRIPRIKLLLQEIIKRSDPSHIDYTLLNNSLSIVDQVALSLNESKRMAENQSIVIDLFERIKKRFGNFLQAHRKYVKKFTLELAYDSVEDMFDCFIFTDMLLLVPIINTNGIEETNVDISDKCVPIYFVFSKMEEECDSDVSVDMTTVLKTIRKRFMFSFKTKEERDDFRCEVRTTMESFEKNLETKMCDEPNTSQIEKRRLKALKAAKDILPVLEMYTRQKVNMNEKLLNLMESLSKEEQVLESQLEVVKSLREDYKKQKKEVEVAEEKEGKVLEGYEDSVNKLVSVDRVIWHMLSQDPDTFREIFDDHPRISHEAEYQKLVITIPPPETMETESRTRRFTVLKEDANTERNRASSIVTSGNPYIQEAYRQYRRKVAECVIERDVSTDECEIINPLYKYKPNRRWFVIEPIPNLPYKYRSDRAYYEYFLQITQSLQETKPIVLPYPEEYNDSELYIDDCSSNLNPKEEEILLGLPDNKDELKMIIMKLETEKRELEQKLRTLQSEDKKSVEQA